MKRALLWLLLALALGTVAGQLMIEDPGYLLLTWGPYVVETSVWVAVAALAIGFLVLLLAVGLLGAVVDAANALRRWQASRRARLALALTQDGLAQYAAADWRRATGTLLKAAELVDAPLLVRLWAARAAEEDQRPDLAAQILGETRGAAGDAAPLVDEQLAAFRRRQGDIAAARTVLERMREQQPRHPRFGIELAAVVEQQGDWKALVEMLPALRKQLAANDWQLLARRAWSGRLAQVAGEPGYPSRKARIDALQHAWKSVPGDFRTDEVVAGKYAALLVQHESAADALVTLEKALSDGDWSDALVTQYGRLDTEKTLEQLAVVEKWLAMRPTNPALLLAAGRVSLRNKLWGKARDYFEASLARQATPEVCAELVRLYTRLGETGRADTCLRRHVELTGSELPKLPLPTARV